MMFIFQIIGGFQIVLILLVLIVLISSRTNPDSNSALQPFEFAGKPIYSQSNVGKFLFRHQDLIDGSDLGDYIRLLNKFGLILGIALIIVHVVNYLFGDVYQPHSSILVASLATPTIIIFLGLKNMKEINSGFLSVGDAIKIGLGISLISTVIYILYLVIFYNIIEPDYFENMIKVQKQIITENNPNITKEQLEAMINNTAMFSTIGTSLTLTMIMNLFFGLIISFFLSFFLKSK